MVDDKAVDCDREGQERTVREGRDSRVVMMATSEEPIFDLADFFVSAYPIYCFKIQKLAFLTNI
jgi:hypothetical protein